MRLHILRQHDIAQPRPLGMACEEEGPSLIEVFKVIIQCRIDVGPRLGPFRRVHFLKGHHRKLHAVHLPPVRREQICNGFKGSGLLCKIALRAFNHAWVVDGADYVRLRVITARRIEIDQIHGFVRRLGQGQPVFRPGIIRGHAN